MELSSQLIYVLGQERGRYVEGEEVVKGMGKKNKW